ncbi:ArsC/Spx/MgsR family protein [Lactococcus garvieae]|uniref:ArsC/Spx/MgsR family protein n=1 Tax=Lactococcus garvieae TaxID=1363 RepID=UPI0003826A79|nr:ArsC/Spx/MgsR family protein [Lactococcus garvieae]
MILLYYATNSLSCRKSFAWFEHHNIKTLQKRIECITQKDLIHALSLTDHGFTDILKRGDLCTVELQAIIKDILTMSFNESIELILNHPEILRVPLIIDKNKLLIGHDSEKIRIFIPKSVRKFK